jgi:hypothetical protein
MIAKDQDIKRELKKGNTLQIIEDSLNDYQKHWVTSGHKGPCQPNKADCDLHGWTLQGKDWEL